MINYEQVLSKIEALPSDWHGSGPLSGSVLRTIAGFCKERGSILNSVETGAGKSTLFFSQISGHHTVFAIDIGMSLTKVKESTLISEDNVEFIEGPTQITVPKYEFTKKLDVVLIDGPHGYPFPDLEYYYFYPHLRKGGLLIIDDINIPSIKRMASIVKNEDMFECLEQIGKTMILQRTDAKPFDPLADGWWEQGYNKPYLNRTKRLEKFKRKIPKPFFKLIPESLLLLVQKYL